MFSCSWSQHLLKKPPVASLEHFCNVLVAFADAVLSWLSGLGFFWFWSLMLVCFITTLFSLFNDLSSTTWTFSVVVWGCDLSHKMKAFLFPHNFSFDLLTSHVFFSTIISCCEKEVYFFAEVWAEVQFQNLFRRWKYF